MSAATIERLDREQREHENALYWERREQSSGERYTPYGADGDHCAFCGRDWKQPHDVECPHHITCAIPIGCDKSAAPGRVICREHIEQFGPLFATT